MDVVKTVDPLPRQMGDRRAQILILGPGRLIIRCADGVEAIHLQFVCPVDQLAIVVNIPFHRGKTFDVILFGSHRRCSFLFPVYFFG
jgi:hypothetical protein